MKRWFLAALCCLLATAAHAELHLLVGPSLLLDRQNAITGTAMGLNVTLWGLVPNRPHLGVVGVIDPVLYLASSWKPGIYAARVVEIADGVIAGDRVEELWFSGGDSRIVKLTLF